MLYYIARRLGVALMVALTVSFLAYVLVFVSGDPAVALAGEGARAADIEMVRKTYGFDRPGPGQDAEWLRQVFGGGLGTSRDFKDGEGARAADIEMVRKTYGFDRPVPVQYAEWLRKLLRGDLGTSVYFKTEVAALIADKLTTTLVLGAAAIAVALAISVPLGVMAAIWR